jgi:hypothetical protein
VTTGGKVSVVGTVTGQGPCCAEKVTVDAEEGADLLTAQGQHVSVPRTGLTFDE